MNKKNIIITVLSVLLGTTTTTAIVVPLILMDQNKKNNLIKKEKMISNLGVSPKFSEYYNTIGDQNSNIVNTILNAATPEEKMSWVYATNSKNQVINDGIQSVKRVDVKEVAGISTTEFEVLFNEDYEQFENLSNIVTITNKKIINISWKITAKDAIQKLILDNGFVTAADIENRLNLTYGSSTNLQKVIDISLPNLVTNAKFSVDKNEAGTFDINLKNVLLNSNEYAVKQIDPLTNLSVVLNWTDIKVTNDYVWKFFNGKKFSTNENLVVEVQKPEFKNYLKVLIQQNNLITNLETNVKQVFNDKALITNLIVSVNIKGYDKPIILPTIENIPAQLTINLEFKPNINLHLEQIIQTSETAGNTLELVKEIFAIPANRTSIFNHLTDDSKLQVIDNKIIDIIVDYDGNILENKYNFMIIFQPKQNFTGETKININGVKGKITTP